MYDPSIFSYEPCRRLRPGSWTLVMFEFKPWSWITEMTPEMTMEIGDPTEISERDVCPQSFFYDVWVMCDHSDHLGNCSP